MAIPRPTCGAADVGGLARARTEAAQLRSFTQEGAGARRRDAITAVTGEWLTATWPTSAAPREGVALAAVGSLARGDSGPGSDLDLVLLHDGRHSAAAIERIAQEIWYPLWDSGIRLDHSVRTLADCRDVARADLVAAVGLLDVRLVAGDADLVSMCNGSCCAWACRWVSRVLSRFPRLPLSLFVAQLGTAVVAGHRIVANLAGGTLPNHVAVDGKGAAYAINKSKGVDDAEGDRISRIVKK